MERRRDLYIAIVRASQKATATTRIERVDESIERRLTCNVAGAFSSLSFFLR
jgi:hypothetical protein